MEMLKNSVIVPHRMHGRKSGKCTEANDRFRGGGMSMGGCTLAEAFPQGSARVKRKEKGLDP